MRITIADYDPEWPIRFEAERERILDAVPEGIVRIEHIGSTSVPGLAAKPIIDLLVGVTILSDAERVVPQLEPLGYEYIPEFEDVMPERRYLRKPVEGTREFNLHMVSIGTRFWVRHLAFRDWLRRHPEDCRDYEQLKRDLARRFPDDIGSYAEAKTDFVRAVERRALLGFTTEGNAEIRQPVGEHELEIVNGFLRDFNRESLGLTDAEWNALDDSVEPLQRIVRTAGEGVLGGLQATTSSAWLKIHILAIREEARHRGLGTRLLREAEAEAIRRGCQYAYVDTMGYQSPEFYRQHGYEVVGMLPDWNSRGHTKYFLTKRLA